MHDLRVTFLFPKLLFNTTFRHICYMIVAFCFLSCRMCPWKRSVFTALSEADSTEASKRHSHGARWEGRRHCPIVANRENPFEEDGKSFLCTSYSLKYQPQSQWPSQIDLLQCDPYESLPRIDNGGAPVACKILMLLLQTKFVEFSCVLPEWGKPHRFARAFNDRSFG